MSRFLLVGWDAADWKVIDPLLRKGEMPHLARLLEGGVRGNLATIHPPLSPMVWTSIATGKRPPKHGILGFTEPTADGFSVQPIGILGRRTKALWNILHQSGKTCIVVGWWPSHPAEPIRGAVVSDLFPFRGHQRAPMPPGTVSPVAIAERMSELRVHPTEIDGSILSLFVPGWRAIDQEKDKSLHALAGIVAETMSIHAAATELMEIEPWDVAAVYYCGIDHFSHRFMRYHARRRLAGDDAANRQLLAGIVENAYRYHDVMLGRLLALAGDDCSVMLVSDHGFHSDNLLPAYIPAEMAGPAVEHRHFGVFCLRAPGVRAGETIYGASVLDVAPTALHVLGLPAGLDMDGKVLVNAFRDGRPARRIESWDDVPGEDGSHPAGEQYDGAAAAASLAQLVDLGYIAPQGNDARAAIEECLTEERYNLARAHVDAGRPELALPLFRELIVRDPEDGRFYSSLAACLMQMEDFNGCSQALESFDRAAAKFSKRAAEELARRAAKLKTGVAQLDNAEARRELFECRRLAEKADGFAAERLFLRCRLALNQRRDPRAKEQARALLEQIGAGRRLSPGTKLFLARGFAALKEYDRALELLERVRRADRDSWEALGLEARVHFGARRYEQAVNRAVESLALVYVQPWLHCLLGVSLARLGEREKAEQALRAALSQAPEYAAAHDALGRLLLRDRARVGEGSLHMARAAEFRRLAKQRRAERRQAPSAGAEPAATLPAFDRSDIAPPADRSRIVTVVTGLPRTGTSMMMQTLAAAGVPAFSDEERPPDEDNPRGYLEHQSAARLHLDASWLTEARGKAVKIVAHLLPSLEKGLEYRVIFMYRDLRDVAASQRAMLRRLGREGARVPDLELMRALAQQMVRVQTWLRRSPQIPVLAVRYEDALADPDAVAARLAQFLGSPFDSSAASRAIDPSLRRQGQAAPSTAPIAPLAAQESAPESRSAASG